MDQGVTRSSWPALDTAQTHAVVCSGPVAKLQ